MKAIDKFFIAAFSVLFVVSLTYVIISWVMLGSTRLTFWIAPLLIGFLLMGFLLMMELRTKRD